MRAGRNTGCEPARRTGLRKAVNDSLQYTSATKKKAVQTIGLNGFARFSGLSRAAEEVCQDADERYSSHEYKGRMCSRFPTGFTEEWEPRFSTSTDV
jgi:hypothetical protein